MNSSGKSVEHQSLCSLLKKSISCSDCVGMSSLVSDCFIEFYLASSNNELVNTPLILLAPFFFFWH